MEKSMIILNSNQLTIMGLKAEACICARAVADTAAAQNAPKETRLTNEENLRARNNLGYTWLWPEIPELRERWSDSSSHVSAGHGPGGRGNTGVMYHHRILFDKYHPGVVFSVS
ncbi:hypothetical protein CCACVL1_06861 [Corchorus capsularis]|uniref:Uncharacterized protein n=1 Tax=Corchorus capsularis TaxID=210143 RepID=A0A1R3JC32_COCAP|nr:hypothetical protein CCACVL1_06861 [Corchorus capsularis]